MKKRGFLHVLPFLFASLIILVTSLFGDDGRHWSGYALFLTMTLMWAHLRLWGDVKANEKRIRLLEEKLREHASDAHEVAAGSLRSSDTPDDRYYSRG